jgi:hypothetical protein
MFYLKSLKTVITTHEIIWVNEPLNFYTEYSKIIKQEKINLNRELRKLMDMDKIIPS